MPNRRTASAMALTLACAAAVAAGLIWGRGGLYRNDQPGARSAALPAKSLQTWFPETPVSSSPYLNTGAAARYVGSQACRQCHADRDRSYQKSMMAHSMAVVDPAREPADGEFLHQRSGRRYKIYRDGGELRQRESLTFAEGEDQVLADFAVKYVVGSGHFSRTYLSEIDGFMVEAPATWFAARQGWDMSPGYDQPFPDGFERAMTETCLYCHSGRIEPVDGTLHKFEVFEAAIGCERCHGPGSLHVDRWEHRPATGGRVASAPALDPTIDPTIVNPADLPRDLAEAVCQQCHLTSSAQAPARGRHLSEFRPGLPLQDFCASYRTRGRREAMKVVGHFDQMALSRCYRESGTLTCLTCHNPHDEPGPEDRPRYYQAICLNCHGAEACRVAPAVRAEKSAGNDCVQCHMPNAPTEIVHLAFTHHRIGVHGAEPSEPRALKSEAIALEPWHDLSRLPEIDRDRSLGLAYFDSGFDPGPQSRAAFEKSFGILEGVRARGLRDGAVDAALAQIASQARFPNAPDFAAAALADEHLAPAPRIRALYILAADHYENRRPAQAAALLDELTRLRRCSADWALLGLCRLAGGDSAAATRALEQAVALNPKLLPLHRELVQLYEASGQADKATAQRRLGRRLQEIGRAAGAATGH